MSRILIIDDDVTMLEMMSDLLDSNGYSVSAATNGQDALKLVSNTSFDLIVTDILMDETDGLEIILKLKKNNHTIPVIAISGGGKLDSAYYLQLAQLFGAVVIFEKPFENDDFLAAVREKLAP